MYIDPYIKLQLKYFASFNYYLWQRPQNIVYYFTTKFITSSKKILPHYFSKVNLSVFVLVVDFKVSKLTQITFKRCVSQGSFPLSAWQKEVRVVTLYKLIWRQGIFRVQKLLVGSFESGSWRVVMKSTATENFKIKLM